VKDVFKDIVDMDGVKGAMLLSFDGAILFEDYRESGAAALEPGDREGLLAALDGVQETDAVYRDGRIYIRRSDLGFLLVNMSAAASAAMLRLNCDILLPTLKSTAEPKGMKRFFRK
jgi:hypothetical protein